MRLLVSIVGFQPGRTFGAETYLRGLLQGLSIVRDDIDIIVVGFRDAIEWVSSNNCCLKIYDLGRLPVPRLRRSLEGIMISYAHRRVNADVVFFPFNTMPKVNKPSILMVHDLVSFFYREHFPKSRPIRNRLLSSLVTQSVVRASAVVTPSAAIANEIKTTLRRIPKRLVPIWEAPGPVATFDGGVTSIQYNEEFILVQTGSKLPHKAQHLGLIAMSELFRTAPELCGRVRLVVTGCSEHERNELMKLLSGDPARASVSLLGKVDNQQLEALMAHATIVLFPTLYEGFGLGIIEAQLRGLSVVASDIPVLREVSGGHAEFFPPGNSSEMTTAIYRLLLDEPRRKELAEAGIRHAQRWNWEDHARSLISLVKEVAT